MILNGTKPIDDIQQWVFPTLSVDGDECSFTHVAPADLTGQDLQDYINAKEGAYRLDILKDMYPGANVIADLEHETMVEAFEAWVAAGHKNITVVDGEEVEVIIEKAPWANTHPEDLYQITVLDFRKRFTLEEKVAIHSSVDPLVQVFLADLSAAQFVDFRDPDLNAGLAYLKSIGLLTDGRVTEITAK